MKKFLPIGLILLMLLSVTDASAQRRYGKRYGGYGWYPARQIFSVYPGYPRYPRLSVIASLPFGAVMVSIGGVHYHYYNGMYYRPRHSGYIMVTPPIGIIVPALPPGHVRVMIGSIPYYRYEGIYYLPMEHNRYEVVQKPEEKLVPETKKEEVTNGYEKLVIEGRTYYKKGDVYYKAVVDEKGEIKYEEVGK
jgi:hypothetical protein